jgi:aquaporin Z
MARKLVVEAIGTFFLVLTIGLVILGGGAGPMAPVPIAAALMAMIYAGGHVSGAHYNPAVTLGAFLRGVTDAGDLARYWVAQVLAAVAAAFVVPLIVTDPALPPLAIDVVPALLAEFLYTFALVFVVLNVATARGTRGNSYFGLGIALVVVTGAYAVGGVSGASFNPAVTIALKIWNLHTAKGMWILLMGELLGGMSAALLFNMLDLGDDKPTTATAEAQGGLRDVAEPQS